MDAQRPVGLAGLALGLDLLGLDELAPRMRPAAGMGDGVIAHDLGIALVAVGEQDAAIVPSRRAGTWPERLGS
jgi:hypothetical protein